ncbi:MAG TPA: hypothetical protein VID73_05155 [Ktedonobacterales bacterium]|jgi:hypothetical protein
MARAGMEAKLAWRGVPLAVRRETGRLLGAPVARGARVWGGYGPAPTFRLRLADGRRAFFKGVHGASSDFARDALAAEERVYRELGTVIAPWSPRYFGALRVADWRALLLEDVGPPSAPPWTPSLTRRVAHAYADFHAATLGAALPDWLEPPARPFGEATWERVAARTDGLRAVAALASARADEAHAWLVAARPALAQAGDQATALDGPLALLHLDTRSDNLRWTGGRLALFDWPWAGVGRPEFDVVPFAQSVTVDGGAAPEQVVAWYAERLPLRAAALDAAVAWLAAFFALNAWQPDVPELPRLRSFQRRQLAVVLRWAARRLDLPDPVWVAALA